MRVWRGLRASETKGRWGRGFVRDLEAWDADLVGRAEDGRRRWRGEAGFMMAGWEIVVGGLWRSIGWYVRIGREGG